MKPVIEIICQNLLLLCILHLTYFNRIRGATSSNNHHIENADNIFLHDLHLTYATTSYTNGKVVRKHQPMGG